MSLMQSKLKMKAFGDLKFISKYFFSGSSSLVSPYYSTISLYFDNG